MCALWRYLFGRDETVERKHAVHRYVAGQFKRLVRDREPFDYIQHLPSSASDFRRWYPRQFAAAFPGALPIRVPGEPERGVMKVVRILLTAAIVSQQMMCAKMTVLTITWI